jgi:type IX secretion system PorP/SprF family membrane protein
MHKLSIGFQSVLVNKRLNPAEISFATQFSSNGFDLSLPSDEFFQNNNINYVDWNTGLNYTHANESGVYHVGFSGYHLTRPEESFLGDKTNIIPVRYSLSAGANRYMGETGVLLTSALFQQQARSRELTLGVAYGQYLSSPDNDISVFMGAWYRINDSFIPYFGFNYNDLQIGLSYDIVASSLNLSKTNNRSFEISAIYSFRDKSTDKRFIPWY